MRIAWAAASSPEVFFGEVTWTCCRLDAEMKCGREFTASHPRMGRHPLTCRRDISSSCPHTIGRISILGCPRA